jgi:hypothetical protein
MSTFQDDFQAAERASTWGRTTEYSKHAVAQQYFGQLVISYDGPSEDRFEYVSSYAYDMTDEEANIQLLRAPTLPGAMAYFTLNLDRGDWIGFQLQDKKLSIMQAAAGKDPVTNAKAVFDPAQQVFWRMRHSGGALTWETSPDGASWNTVATASPSPVDLTRVYVRFGAYFPDQAGKPGLFDQAVFAGFNAAR